MKNFHELKVWERSHQLTLVLYRLTRSFPKEELYGLTNQIRRSSASIPTNIAEGCGHGSQAEMIRYFQVAMASSSELEYQVLLAHDLEYLDEKTYREQSAELMEIRRMLNSYLKKLRSTMPPK